MAWYAEYRRRNNYNKLNELNMNKVYKQYLYDSWYNSLTDEDKQALEEAKRKKREESNKKLEDAFNRLGRVFDIFDNCMGYRCNTDKYHGLYDSFGRPVADIKEVVSHIEDMKAIEEYKKTEQKLEIAEEN